MGCRERLCRIFIAFFSLMQFFRNLKIVFTQKFKLFLKKIGKNMSPNLIFLQNDKYITRKKQLDSIRHLLHNLTKAVD